MKVNARLLSVSLFPSLVGPERGGCGVQTGAEGWRKPQAGKKESTKDLTPNLSLLKTRD